MLAAGTKVVNIRTGRSGTIKNDISVTQIAPRVFQTEKGNQYTTAKTPGLAALERYCEYPSKTPCGCTTDPDGTCAQHDIPSWPLIMGVM